MCDAQTFQHTCLINLYRRWWDKYLQATIVE